jgi:hypothetical protein
VVVLTLRLRIVPRVWVRAIEADAHFDCTVETYMNAGACWIFNPPPLVGPKVAHLIETGNFRFWLAKPTEPGADWHYDIIHVQRLRPEDHTERSVGAQIDTDIAVTPPSAGKAVRLDEETQQHPTDQIIFYLRVADYRKLPEHERVPITLAYCSARQGRDARRLWWMEDRIFVLTADGSAPTVSRAAENLGEMLEAAGVGRLLTDPYEVKRVLELADKFGENLAA